MERKEKNQIKYAHRLQFHQMNQVESNRMHPLIQVKLTKKMQ